MLAVGAFSPLDRFMGQDEYESVLYEMHLESGELFPIPLAVPCREEVLRGRPREVALSDEEGTILALLEVDEVYPADILREMRAVLGGRDSAHPLVIEAKGWPSHYLAGRRACSTCRATACTAPCASRPPSCASASRPWATPPWWRSRRATPCTASTRSSPSALCRRSAGRSSSIRPSV